MLASVGLLGPSYRAGGTGKQCSRCGEPWRPLQWHPQSQRPTLLFCSWVGLKSSKSACSRDNPTQARSVELSVKQRENQLSIYELMNGEARYAQPHSRTSLGHQKEFSTSRKEGKERGRKGQTCHNRDRPSNPALREDTGLRRHVLQACI